MASRHASQKRYPPELKERAVRMVQEGIAAQGGQRFGVVTRVAPQLSIGPESLRQWMNQAEVDAGRQPGTSTADAQRIAELEREVKDCAGQRHSQGGVGFLRDRARRSPEEVERAVAFIDAHRDRETGGRRWGSSSRQMSGSLAHSNASPLVAYRRADDTVPAAIDTNRTDRRI